MSDVSVGSFVVGGSSRVNGSCGSSGDAFVPSDGDGPLDSKSEGIVIDGAGMPSPSDDFGGTTIERGSRGVSSDAELLVDGDSV